MFSLLFNSRTVQYRFSTTQTIYISGCAVAIEVFCRLTFSYHKVLHFADNNGLVGALYDWRLIFLLSVLHIDKLGSMRRDNRRLALLLAIKVKRKLLLRPLNFLCMTLSLKYHFTLLTGLGLQSNRALLLLLENLSVLFRFFLTSVLLFFVINHFLLG